MTINASLSVLNQLNDLLSQLKPIEYTQKLSVFNGSSIGQHVRHTVEFFQCLLEGFDTGTIDYDARKRNILIETDLNYTLTLVEMIQQKIKGISNTYSPIQLRVRYGEIDFELIETNFMRELVYLIEHSIHHFALIRIGIQENFKQVTIETNFGVAYSTIKFKEKITVYSN
ncbi:hypothetical protein Emtol_3550 [Emticicia oligotrophica DSM 17448]|uniref:DinB family protein n=1 Tax=Emticicia oligotrophica (strain DSM 17448 / CIP 109782 / MTCC 6937 / GPTSA100-15) TaxID=929562 RepID=A0ABM5N5J7_EMTOG|nr:MULTISPECIES: DinB family protein [Emticicia]AFK04678.1 hypothetical protein Emtol_3550 [Emticicia oligotrophica DSM 17448]